MIVIAVCFPKYLSCRWGFFNGSNLFRLWGRRHDL